MPFSDWVIMSQGEDIRMSTERSSHESLVRNRVEGEWNQFKESLESVRT